MHTAPAARNPSTIDYAQPYDAAPLRGFSRGSGFRHGAAADNAGGAEYNRHVHVADHRTGLYSRLARSDVESSAAAHRRAADGGGLPELSYPTAIHRADVILTAVRRPARRRLTRQRQTAGRIAGDGSQRRAACHSRRRSGRRSPALGGHGRGGNGTACARTPASLSAVRLSGNGYRDD